MKPTTVPLESIVGTGVLTGCDFTGDDDGGGLSMVFVLNGQKYRAIEDPEDGYRSSCEDLQVLDDNIEIQNTFLPHIVDIKCTRSPYNEWWVLIEMICVRTGAVVLRIGTEGYDEYYPCCVMSFDPTAMHVNKRGDLGRESDEGDPYIILIMTHVMAVLGLLLMILTAFLVSP